jgi:hypothetical protein
MYIYSWKMQKGFLAHGIICSESFQAGLPGFILMILTWHILMCYKNFTCRDDRTCIFDIHFFVNLVTLFSADFENPGRPGYPAVHLEVLFLFLLGILRDIFQRQAAASSSQPGSEKSQEEGSPPPAQPEKPFISVAVSERDVRVG